MELAPGLAVRELIHIEDEALEPPNMVTDIGTDAAEREIYQ
jgi:hypothetical protein